MFSSTPVPQAACWRKGVLASGKLANLCIPFLPPDLSFAFAIKSSQRVVLKEGKPIFHLVPTGAFENVLGRLDSKILEVPRRPLVPTRGRTAWKCGTCYFLSPYRKKVICEE